MPTTRHITSTANACSYSSVTCFQHDIFYPWQILLFVTQPIESFYLLIRSTCLQENVFVVAMLSFSDSYTHSSSRFVSHIFWRNDEIRLIRYIHVLMKMTFEYKINNRQMLFWCLKILQKIKQDKHTHTHMHTKRMEERLSILLWCGWIMLVMMTMVMFRICWNIAWFWLLRVS